jgi:peptide/nickel transport system permease protein
MLSGMLYGLRISLGIGIVATLAALSLGTTLGLLAAYAGGRWDALLMRLVDVQLSFPAILLALVLITVLSPGIGNVALALVAVQWAYYARTVRAAALVERRKEYVEAAQGLGLPHRRVLFRHLLPNCLPPVIVVAALQVANAIALEATLSFLGIGVPITEPSLGLMIANGQQFLLAGQNWMSVYPGVLLLVTILAINLVADQLRDVANPRLQKP